MKFNVRHLAAVMVLQFCLFVNLNAQPANMLRFDGINDYISCGNILPSGSYTKEVWISAGFFGSSTSNLISGTQTAFWCPNGRLRAGHSIGNAFSDVIAPVGFTMSNNTWYHLAVTYNSATNTLTLFQDGVQVAQGPASGPYNETGVFIGGFNPNPDPNSAYEGRLDEVRIWNIVRTPAEIAATRLCALTGDEPGLVAHYDFEQGIPDGNNATETTLFDRVDRCIPRNGTLHNFALNGGSSNWSGPGAELFFTGNCPNTFANITLEGNSVCIESGDATPGSGDHTFFDNADSRTFTIRNTGGATLNITGVSLSGTGAAQFSVTTPPAASVVAGGTTTFTITRALVAGNHEATVTVASADVDEATYSFGIETSVVLSVELTAFHAERMGADAKLTWTTASEHDSHGFNILRSPNSTNWTVIGFEAGAGNSNTINNYTFIDPNPLPGINYYRLEMIDRNNDKSLSDIQSVRFAGDLAVIYPVPARDELTIESSSTSSIGAPVSITDIQGRTIMTFRLNSLKHVVPLKGLPAGTYIIRMQHGESHRFVKQ